MQGASASSCRKYAGGPGATLPVGRRAKRGAIFRAVVRQMIAVQLVGMVGTAYAQDFYDVHCERIANARLVAQDGTFLGTIGTEYDPDSIFNEYSLYGSEYGPDSILNENSIHGSLYSDFSPFNEYASRPPWLTLTDGVDVLVTVNEIFEEAMNPYTILECGK